MLPTLLCVPGSQERRGCASPERCGAQLGKGSAPSLFSEGKEPEVSVAGGFCHSPPPPRGLPLSRSSPLALHQLVKLPRSRAAPWPDPESRLGSVLCQRSEFEGVLAMEVLSLPSARLELSFALGVVVPPLYIRLLPKNILGQPQFKARCQTSAGGGPVAVKNWQSQRFTALAPSGNLSPEV